MKKEDIIVLAQLLSSMKDAIAKIEKAQKEGDSEQIEFGKKQILDFQKKIDEIL